MTVFGGITGMYRTIVFVGVAALVVGCSTLDSPAFVSGHEALSPDLIDANGFVRPPSDSNQYRALQLDNGLDVLLVQSQYPRAGVTLDIQIGSGDDPETFPGLAHFLEHMLFLGTEKYPQPDGYQTFIRENGGDYNATTGLDHTNYFFSIDAAQLPQAMDRLAHFFIDPLFTPEYVDRELEIIEAEYRRSLDSEDRALYAGSTKLYHPDHPAAQFTAGNRAALLANGRQALYQALLDFYRQYYRTGNMRLVVVGTQPLNTLERLTRDTFGRIQAQGDPEKPTRPTLYHNLPQLVEVRSQGEHYSLDFAFPLPNQDANIFHKPASYVAHLLGDESQGSLLAWLRQRNWAHELSAGSAKIGEDHSLRVHIGLTRQGNAHIDTIYAALFSYIDIIKAQALSETWRFDELAQMASVDFRWQQASDPLSQSRGLARMMHYLPAQQLFQAMQLFGAINPTEVEAVLDALRPDNTAITHIAPDRITDAEDPYYNTRYRVTALANDFANRAAAPRDLALPEPNAYIPDQLQIGKVDTGQPQRLANEVLHVWHYSDAHFALPLGSIYFGMSLASLMQDPKQRMLLSVYRMAQQQAFEQEFYAARVAGLQFSLYTHLRGIGLRVQGYDQMLPALFGAMLTRLAQWELSREDFTHYRAEVARSIANEQHDGTISRLYQRGVSSLLPYQWNYERRLEAVQRITYNDWLALRQKLLDQPSERSVLVHGEFTDTSIHTLLARIEPLFPSSLTQVDLYQPLPILGPQLVHEPVREGQQSNVLMQLYAGLDPTPRHYILTRLAASYLGGPFFHFMRTENKLGYQASVQPFDLLRSPGLFMLVESSTTKPQTLYEFYQQFFAQMRASPPSKEVFSTLVAAQKAALQEPPLRISNESDRIWNEIAWRNERFDTKEQWLQALSQLTLQDFTAFLEQVLSPAAQSQSVWLFSGDHTLDLD